MIFLISLLGIVLAGVSCRLVAQAFVVPRLQLKEHLRAIQDYGFESASSQEEIGSRAQLNQAIGLMAQRVGSFMMRTFTSLTPLKRGDLTAAGFYDVTPEAVHGYRTLAAILLPMTFLLLVLMSGG